MTDRGRREWNAFFVSCSRHWWNSIFRRRALRSFSFFLSFGLQFTQHINYGTTLCSGVISCFSSSNIFQMRCGPYADDRNKKKKKFGFAIYSFVRAVNAVSIRSLLVRLHLFIWMAVSSVEPKNNSTPFMAWPNVYPISLESTIKRRSCVCVCAAAYLLLFCVYREK